MFNARGGVVIFRWKWAAGGILWFSPGSVCRVAQPRHQYFLMESGSDLIVQAYMPMSALEYKNILVPRSNYSTVSCLVV
jgi:hypothetical protein